MKDPIESCILDLLKRRGEEGSLCPSEVARRLWPANWRPHMDEVRQKAVEMAMSEVILITKGDRIVEPEEIKGAIRLRRGSGFTTDEE